MRAFLLIALAVPGCVRKLRPPPAQELRLGTKVAPYRAYAPGTLCSAGPGYQPVLKAELEAMNELLAAFLEGTASGPEGVWDIEHVELVAHAQATLLPVLDAYEETLYQASRCRFEARHGFRDLVVRGLEQVEKTRERVASAAELLPQLRARAELKKWKDQQAVEQETEHANWCPPRPRPAPDVYFALSDETGRTEWLFCDGSRVVDEAGKAPEYVPPKAGHPVSRALQGAFLRAAGRYPQSQIRRPPKAPAAPAATSEESPASGSR